MTRKQERRKIFFSRTEYIEKLTLNTEVKSTDRPLSSPTIKAVTRCSLKMKERKLLFQQNPFHSTFKYFELIAYCLLYQL